MKRERLASALASSGALDAVFALRRHARVPWLTVLTYHRVCPLEDAASLDDGTIDALPDAFLRQLDAIADEFRTISIDDLAGHLRGKRLPPNPLLLTFDDGYKDNADFVLPRLVERGLSAAFFVATSFPGEGRLYWWDRAAWLVSRMQREPVRLTSTLSLELRPVTDRAGSLRALLSAIKDTRDLDLGALFDELEAAGGLGLARDEERAIASRTIMGWDDVSRLLAAGMDVESHSHRHRVLATLDDAALLDDLVTSRETLAARTGKASRAIAYPVGRSISARERRIVAEAGFELGFTNASGTSLLSRLDALAVKRLAMGRDISDALFRTGLAVPQLFYRSGA